MSNKTQEVLEIYKAKVMPTYTPSVVLASGKGITVRDVDGLSYYDFTSGIGVQAVGYSNKKVVEAIQKQAAQNGVYTWNSTPWPWEYGANQED